MSSSMAKPVTSPVAISSYPTMAGVMLAVGLLITFSFFIYEATSISKRRSFIKEGLIAAVASGFLGFGLLFLLLSTGVYV